jgi:hypothetical protein
MTSAHVVEIHTQLQSDEEGNPTGCFRYRWRCSCGKHGPWRTGTTDSGHHAAAASSARTGGTRHVAAMERGR